MRTGAVSVSVRVFLLEVSAGGGLRFAGPSRAGQCSRRQVETSAESLRSPADEVQLLRAAKVGRLGSRCEPLAPQFGSSQMQDRRSTQLRLAVDEAATAEVIEECLHGPRQVQARR